MGAIFSLNVGFGVIVWYWQPDSKKNATVKTRQGRLDCATKHTRSEDLISFANFADKLMKSGARCGSVPT
jgi:hypothetical protein